MSQRRPPSCSPMTGPSGSTNEGLRDGSAKARSSSRTAAGTSRWPPRHDRLVRGPRRRDPRVRAADRVRDPGALALRKGEAAGLAAVRARGRAPLRRPARGDVHRGPRGRAARGQLRALLAGQRAHTRVGLVPPRLGRVRHRGRRAPGRARGDEPLPQGSLVRLLATGALPQLRCVALCARARHRRRNRPRNRLGARALHRHGLGRRRPHGEPLRGYAARVGKVRDEVSRRLARGERIALATVVATRRSAPRPVGSKLVVSDNGELYGSVSGGCVESDVAVQAAEVIVAGEPRLLTYGISDDQAWGIGLPCGGEIDVFVQRLERELPADANGALLTALEGPRAGQQWAAEDVEGPSRVLELDGEKVFAEVTGPPPRLVVVGATDTAEEL